jgi:hypothetical protein
MVVFKIDVLGVFAGPTERNPVVSGYAHGPFLRSSAQTVEPVPGHGHVLRLSRHFQGLQDTDALSDVFGPDAACLASGVELFQSLVSETGDHFSTVNQKAYTVKPRVATTSILTE